MSLIEAYPVAKAKGRPKPALSDDAPRATIANLKGPAVQAEWLETVHRSTHLSKATIIRLALVDWAKNNGHPPFPMSAGDD